MKNIENNIKNFTTYLEDIIAKDFISNCHINDTVILDNYENQKNISSDNACIEG